MRDDLHQTVTQRLGAVEQRYTKGRRHLVQALADAEGPLSLPELLSAGVGPQSSAYRHVAVLEQAGVVHRIAGTGDHARFELAEDLSSHHHHLMCTECGTVIDVDLPVSLERSLNKAIADVEKSTGFAANTHRLDVIGRCSDCR